MPLEEDLEGDISGDNNRSYAGESGPVSRLVITQVQRGPTSKAARELGVQGRPVLSMLIRHTDPRIVANSLEIHDRKGHKVWVDGVDCTPTVLDEPTPPPEPVVTTATAPTPIVDPELGLLRRQAEEQRVQIRQLEQQAAAAQRFLELLLTEIEDAHKMHHTVRDQIEQAGATSFKNANRLQDEAVHHALEQLRAVQGAERGNVEKLRDLMKDTNETLGLSAELQARMREALKPQTWRETIHAAKDFLSQVVAGPVGMIGHGWIQAQLSARRGQQVDTVTVLDMQALHAERLRARYTWLRSMLVTQPPHQVTQAIAVTADYIEGQIGEQALAHYVKHATAPRDTVSQGR